MSLTLIMSLALVAGQDEIPPECRYDAAGRVNYQACADATEPGMVLHSLSLMNLGSIAAMEGDNARAAARYDEASASGGSLHSDSVFHSLRAHVYDHVGRTDEALADARYAAGQLLRNEGHQVGEHALNPDPETALSNILPILYRAGDPDFGPAMAAYLAIPANDWFALGNRAVTLLDLEQYEAALETNTRAMASGPEHPVLLNSQCYILTLLGRASEGLAFCERAAGLAPDVAAVRHSYASALAGVGRCQEAETQLAEARRLDPVSPIYQEALTCTSA